MVTNVACNVRKSNTTDSAVVGSLKSNIEIAVEGIVGGWYELPLSWGYIRQDLLREKTTPPIDPNPPNPPLPPPPPLGNWYVPMQKVRGVGISAGGWSPDAGMLNRVTKNNIKTAFICAYERGQAKGTIKALKNAGVNNFIFRGCWRGGMEFFAEESADILAEYYNEMENVYGAGNFPFVVQVHNEPNLTTEGYLQKNGGWNDGYAFAEFYRKTVLLYKSKFTNLFAGFPALSPGVGIVSGTLQRRAETVFASECASVIKDTKLTSWVGVHYYWQDAQGADITPPMALWQKIYYNRPLIATEVAPVDSLTISNNAVKISYQRFDSVGVPAIGYILSGTGAWVNADWMKNNILLN